MERWGAGLATFAGDRSSRSSIRTRSSGAQRRASRWSSNERADELRGMRQAAVLTVIEDLQQPPQSTADAYLRLHLLSHRLVKPHESTSTASSARCRTSPGRASARSIPPTYERAAQRAARDGRPLQVFSLDKFPRMTDYVTP